ncbi:hypothetical protein WUBG_14867 [Wuchereria bancrofti]|uniref:E3 SUMO-protein ligase NSE2 n=1 Tax=Wuchereria bancrofti TaxID=6293 RepID=J9EFN9_WUCBA|nr:hypothetical protein WUBG_14867 [Wuchereria bancrofti]
MGSGARQVNPSLIIQLTQSAKFLAFLPKQSSSDWLPHLLDDVFSSGVRTIWRFPNVLVPEIKDPVQNRICKHVYDRESVLANIGECKKRRLLCECPVSGCPNKKPLTMADMVAFPKFYDCLKD